MSGGFEALDNITSRELVIAALRGEKTPRVPWCEIGISSDLRDSFEGFDASQQTLEEYLGICNIQSPGGYCPPGFLDTGKSENGRSFVKDGLIKKRSDLDKIVFPDPEDDEMYDEARSFLKDSPQTLARCVVTDLGAGAAIQSMGIEGFSYALADDPEFVKEVFRRYAEWSAKVHQKLCRLGFDFIWSGGDVAFNTAPMFSPDIFREVILPALRISAEAITIPWAYHSDGNLLPILDDLLSLGMNAIHPVEPGAMDIFELKRRYGNKVCLIGNVSVDLLARGTQDRVIEECRNLIDFMKDKGGYIISSGNSLADYVKPENVIAMSRAVKK